MADLPRRLIAPLAVVAAAIAASRPLGWWPCDLRCDGVEGFSRLAGVDAAILAAIGCVVVAVVAAPLMRRHAAHPGLLAAALGLASLLAGGSLCYLALSFKLGVVCPHCLASHAAILALAGCACAARPRPLHAMVAVQAGFLATAALIAVARGAFEPPMPAPAMPVTVPAVDVAAGMTEPGAGRISVDWWIDPSCERCAALHGDVAQRLRAAGATIRQRFLVRDEASRELAGFCLAAGLRGRDEGARAVLLTLGARPGAGVAALAPRLAESLDVAAIESLAATHAAGIAAALAEDAALAARHRIRRTPALLIRDGAAVRVVQGVFEPGAVP